MSDVIPAVDARIGLGFLFMIEFSGEIQGAFTECDGLSAEVEVEEWEEGGLNDHTHRFPSRTSYGNLTLKQASFASSDLYDWFLEIVRGRSQRRPISIILLDSEGSEVRRWNFVDAFPVKWTGPTFDVDSTDAAIEVVEFAHAGLL